MDMMKIGQYIKTRRKAEGLTQQQLAQKLNISFQAVSKWETGDALPDAGLLLELADALSTSTDKILSGGTINAGERKRMRVTDVIEGFSHIEAIGRCFGEDSTFYTGMIEGINSKMNIDLISYLRNPKTRTVMIAEVLIQGIINGYNVDMDEVRVYIANPNMVSAIEGYLNQTSGNHLMQVADGFRNARKITQGQILVMKTISGSIRTFGNDGTDESEKEILSVQEEPIAELICCSCDGEPELPSEFLRTGLLSAFPENASATVFLKTENGLSGNLLSKLL